MQTNKNRLYIEHLENNGEGQINWDRWEIIVAETKRQIYEAIRNNR